MKSNTIIFTLLTLILSVSALPNYWPQPPHHTTTTKPTLSWTATKTSTWAHLPTQSVHNGGWKRDANMAGKDSWGPPAHNPGHMQSVTHKPWHPMPTSTAVSSQGWAQPSGNPWSEGAGRAQGGWKRDMVLEA